MDNIFFMKVTYALGYSLDYPQKQEPTNLFLPYRIQIVRVEATQGKYIATYRYTSAVS